MAIDAILVEYEVRDGRVKVGVVYTDGVSMKVYRAYERATLDDEGLSALAYSEAASFASAKDKQVITLPIGQRIPAPTPATPPSPPTAEAIAEAEYRAAFRVLQDRLAVVEAGLIAADDVWVTEARSAAATLFKPEYVS